MSLEPAISVTPSEIDKVNLLGLSASSLGDLFEQMGEKRFRGTQILKWIHQMGVCDLDQMTNISKPLRARLAELGEVRIPEVVSCQDSVDGTRKWLIRVDGGSCIEMVYIPERERGTLEFLMALPIPLWAMAGGKFLAAWTMASSRIEENRSSPTFTAAFQPACSRAANRTARKTVVSIGHVSKRACLEEGGGRLLVPQSLMTVL